MMLILLWLRGTISRRSTRLLGVAAGIMLTVALLASIGSFIASSAASMTSRAIAGVPVDWQVQLVPGADANAVTTALGQATRYSALERVGYATTAGFSATTGGTVQTTGPGLALGIGARYGKQFPGELRLLVGSLDGALVAQQTAANLHVAPGDSVTIQRQGLDPVTVQVGGVVDLPNADSLFQAVGVPAGTAPQAPPDNVLLLPADQWHQLFDPQATTRPDTVHTQLHVSIGHDLPADPGAAFSAVQGRARNLEARVAGSATVGDNLAARLDGVRADALYAQVLFLFLGLPGAILGALLTLAVAAAGADRRRRAQALLRTRGAATGRILGITGAEACTAAIGGVVLGLALAAAIGQVIAPAGVRLAATTFVWWAGAAAAGIALALVAVLYPAWQQTRQPQWQAGRTVIGRARAPLWQRLYLDLLLLGVAAVAFWQAAGSGYQVVLAPEGVAQSSVAYQAFIAPLCLWTGAALLTMRLYRTGLARARGALARLLRPLAHGLAGAVAASLGRQRVHLTRGALLVALAFSFAISTAVFNTTYNAQARVDAALTNGADVTVTGTTASPAGAKLGELKALPGVTAAQPLQHRLAYVGNDLQDLYGIDPAHISAATTISGAFFAGGNAQATLSALGAHPDGVLVSAETVKDFQLQPGDLLRLRLQNVQDHQYHVVPFHFVGVVREFPTAPKDSFLIANASYVAQQTGSDAAEIVLLRAGGSAAQLAARARSIVGDIGAGVTDIGTARRQVGSSLTAVDLHGLTRLELVYALLMAIGATGLVLALGLAERRRTLTILTALGAKQRQLGAFVWSEGLLVLIGGAACGIIAGFTVAQLLVKLLTGVFDPPPQALSVPWLYLLLLGFAAVASTALAVLTARRASGRSVVEGLRNL